VHSAPAVRGAHHLPHAHSGQTLCPRRAFTEQIDKHPAWARCRRLLRGYERLTDAQFATMWNDLVEADPSSRILTAYIAKEDLRRLLALARSGGHRHEISTRLHRFNVWCADSKLPELQRFAGTVERGGPRCWPSCSPASPTPAPRPPTGR
jgi:hypothetical protein